MTSLNKSWFFFNLPAMMISIGLALLEFQSPAQGTRTKVLLTTCYYTTILCKELDQLKQLSAEVQRSCRIALYVQAECCNCSWSDLKLSVSPLTQHAPFTSFLTWGATCSHIHMSLWYIHMVWRLIVCAVAESDLATPSHLFSSSSIESPFFSTKASQQT